MRLPQAILALAASLIAAPTESFEDFDVIKDTSLAQHNAARAKYGAKPVVWNQSLVSSAQQWANACKFQHSNGGGKYGENLYAGTGNVGVKEAVSSWMGEAAKYDYNHPGFSSGTGHFTQVVWKSSTAIACVVGNCPAGTIFSQPSKYVVCRYTPPGNFQGRYPENVGRPVRLTDEELVLD